MSARLRDKSLSGNIGDVGFLSMRGRTGLTKLRSLEVLFAELPRHGTTLGMHSCCHARPNSKHWSVLALPIRNGCALIPKLGGFTRQS